MNGELEMFYMNSTLNFRIPPVLVFQLEVYYKKVWYFDQSKLKKASPVVKIG